MLLRPHMLVAIAVGISMVACVERAGQHFNEPMTLGGQEVSADVLNSGKLGYGYYCAACHGENGDGRGPASEGLAVPPRDFRVATYKFAGVSEGLPHDEGLEQIVRGGLNGTAMLPWMVRDEPLSAIIQYIKTFSPEGEGWRDPDTPKGNVVKVSEDPWKGKEEAARAAGEALYHGKVSCYSCHPSYVTREEINAHLVAKGSARQTKFRDNLWAPEVKPSQSYSRPVAGDPECSDAQPCEDKDQVCRYGRCEQQIPILPPDFTFNRLRTGNTPARLALLIKSGIPGTAMPAWESIPDKDIWAIAHYVNSLTAFKDTPKASALRQRLKADTAPLAQPEPEPAAPAPTPAIPTEAAESVEVPPTP